MLKFCKAWYAWINRQPVGPPRFHLDGEVEVANPGVEAILTKRPAGANPSVLQLELSLYQKPGMWIQMISCASARYDEVLGPGTTAYTAVEIFQGSASVAKINKVDIVS